MTRYFTFFLAVLTFIFPTFSGAQMDDKATKLVVEPNHSTVGFGISIAGFTRVTGKFTEFQIEIDLVEEDLTKSTITATIDASSITTGIPGRDEHLRSSDFFDVEKYPEITFVSHSIEKMGDEYKAKGYFSMHGIDKEIELPFTLRKMENNTLGFRCRTQINRVDYGVGSGWQHSAIPDFLAPVVDIEIDFWTRKAKA